MSILTHKYIAYLRIFLYVHMYVYLHIYTYIYIYVDTYIFIHIYINIYIQIHIISCTYTCTCVCFSWVFVYSQRSWLKQYLYCRPDTTPSFFGIFIHKRYPRWVHDTVYVLGRCLYANLYIYTYIHVHICKTHMVSMSLVFSNIECVSIDIDTDTDTDTDTYGVYVWYFQISSVYLYIHTRSSLVFSNIECVSIHTHSIHTRYRSSLVFSNTRSGIFKYRVCIYTECVWNGTGWRRLIGSPKLKIIFHKRATKYRALLRKMTYKDKGFYEPSPPCICRCMHSTNMFTFLQIYMGIFFENTFIYIFICTWIYIYLEISSLKHGY